MRVQEMQRRSQENLRRSNSLSEAEMTRVIRAEREHELEHEREPEVYIPHVPRERFDPPVVRRERQEEFDRHEEHHEEHHEHKTHSEPLGNIIGGLSEQMSSIGFSVTSFLKGMGLTGDRLIILGVILVLLEDEMDKTLLLALCYLLL